MSISYPEKDDKGGLKKRPELINPLLLDENEDEAGVDQFRKSGLIQEDMLKGSQLDSSRAQLPPLIDDSQPRQAGIAGSDLPAANYGKRREIQGYDDELAKLKGYKVNHEVADVLQNRLKGEHFARQGRFGAAVATDAARFALNMGQYAAGAGGQAAIPVPVVGYQVGVAAYRGALGAAGEAVRRPAVKYEQSDEGRIAASKQRALDYNEQIGPDGKPEKTDRQKRASVTGVRFREQGDDRTVGRTGAGTAKGFFSSTWQLGGKILSAPFKKDTWRSAWRSTKGALAKVAKLFGRYDVERGDEEPKALKRGFLNKVGRMRPNWLGGKSSTAAPAREHLERQREKMAELESPESMEELLQSGDDQPAASKVPEDANREELQSRRDAGMDEFYEGLLGQPLPSVEAANEHELKKVKEEAKADSETWQTPYDRHKMKADAQTAHMPSWEEHMAMTPAERAETIAREHAILFKSGKLQRGLEQWKQRQQLLGLQVQEGAISKDLAGPGSLQNQENLEEAIENRRQAIEFTTDAQDYQNRRAEMEELVGPGELPFGHGVTFGKNNLLSRLQGHVDKLSERTEPDAEVDDEIRGGKGARWKALADGIPLARPFERAHDAQADDASDADSSNDEEASDSKQGLAAWALGGLGAGGATVGDAVLKGKPVAKHLGKASDAVGLGGTAVGGAAEAISSTTTKIDGLTGTSYVPLLGTAGQALSALGGMLQTGQAYLNQDIDPETTAPRELAMKRSAEEALMGVRKVNARQRGKVLRSPGKIDPHKARLWQAGKIWALNNNNLEKAQTAAGVTTTDELSMLETANFNLDPAKIDVYARETDESKLKSDPLRYKLAKEEKAVDAIVQQRAQQQPAHEQPAHEQPAHEQPAHEQPAISSQQDAEDEDEPIDFADLLQRSRQSSNGDPESSRSNDSHSSGGEFDFDGIDKNPDFAAVNDLLKHLLDPPAEIQAQQQPVAAQELDPLVQQPIRRAGRGSAPLPGLPPQLVEEPQVVQKPPQLVEEPQVVQQPPVVQQQDAQVPVELQPDLEQPQEDRLDALLEDVPDRDSFINHRGGIPNIQRPRDSGYSDDQEYLREVGNASRDSGEMHQIMDDDDLISMDGRKARRRSRDSGEMRQIMDDDDAVSMY